MKIPNLPHVEATTPSPAVAAEESKNTFNGHTLSKFEYDLYHEECDVSFPVIRVKRIGLPNKGDKWKVMSDNKQIFVIESTKISKKEREYLQTLDGFNFILKQAKLGIKSLNGFRSELKKIIAKPSVKKTRIVKTKKAKKNKRA